MIKDYHDFMLRVDLLQGNISRICLTDDMDELSEMVHDAVTTIMDVYIYRYDEILLSDVIKK